MKVYEVPLTFAEHHIDRYPRLNYQVSFYGTIGPLVSYFCLDCIFLIMVRIFEEVLTSTNNLCLEQK